MVRHQVPLVRGDRLDARDGQGTPGFELQVGSPEWIEWLDEHDAFAYKGAGGAFTARRERRHGRWYWYAYRKWRGHLQKEYLGLPSDLKPPRLAHIGSAIFRVG